VCIIHANVYLYADDTTLLVEADSLEEGLDRMRKAMAETKAYCADNGLVLSSRPKKTQFMVIPHSLVVEGEEYEFGEVRAPVRSVMKYLGVHIDAGLTWAAQARSVVGRVTGIARNVAGRMRGLKRAERGRMMTIFAHPVLDFGMVALPNPAAGTVEMLQRAYDRTARYAADKRALLARVPWDKKLSSEDSRKQLGWPQWEDRARALIRCFVLRIWETGVPAELRKLLPSSDRDPTAILQSTRLRQRREIQPVCVSTAVGKKAFGYWAAEVLNEVRSRCPPVDPGCAVDEHVPIPTFPFRREEPDHLVYQGYLRDKYASQGEVLAAGHVVVWTDGSRVELEGRVRAGGGVFYCAGSPRNVAVPAGGVRSAQRAELAAFLAALLGDKRCLEVRSDSRYVVDGVNRDLPQWRARAWFCSPAKAKYISNADLWFQVDKEMATERGSVRVVWVPGHGTLQDVSAGKVAELDVWGNAGADWIAQWAARHCNSMQLGCGHAWHA
jgi:ribonuclease HI